MIRRRRQRSCPWSKKPVAWRPPFWIFLAMMAMLFQYDSMSMYFRCIFPTSPAFLHVVPCFMVCSGAAVDVVSFTWAGVDGILPLKV